MSGKSMSERRAYVKITFRSNPDVVCIDPANCEHKELVFNIQGGSLDGAGVIATGSFPKILTPENWTSKGNPEAGHQLFFPRT